MEEKFNELIKLGRWFTRYNEVEEFQSDQELKKPQPPLFKEKMRSEQIKLPINFKDLELNNDILAIIHNRESHRVFTQETISLLQLSFLLYSTQGVKSIRGNNYATLRTVPCGGARHEFETYLVVRAVEGLKSGAYHYLAQTHELEFLHDVDELEETVNKSLSGQAWCKKASVVFYWSIIPYRSEWRYGIHAHRPALIDAGHIGQNLYIACEATGLGTCVLAAFDDEICAKLFELDNEEEYIVYASPVGTISPKDKNEELSFYAFLNEE